MNRQEVEAYFHRNPALRSAELFPPEETWPELAHLRKEHQRLLAVVSAEGSALHEVQQRYEDEDTARGIALKAQFLTNGDEPGEDNRQTEEYRQSDLEDARLRLEAACDALTTFLDEAVAEVERRAPEFYELLQSRREGAEAKVEEAHRLVAEAERVVGEAATMSNWLDRFSGESALSYVPYADMGVSAARPEPATPLPPLGGVLVT
jgi:hypothetical protein